VTSTVAIIQARTGSTRLPGKVLLPLLGAPMLTRVVRRVSRASRLDATIVATTTASSDDAIVELAEREGWGVERGSETDLLDRYVQVARAHAATTVVRITSDCPLIDPELIDDVVAALDDGDVEYASNSLEPRTYPRGLDVEAMTMAALDQAWREDHDPSSREHATPYIYRHPERFRLRRIASPVDLSAHRWTVDTPEDYELIRRIYERFGRDDFSWREVLTEIEAQPAWSDLNRHVSQKPLPPG
jgi:spore coat polysaccharide biosynthesis protein SpsF